jgi:hypothetical protein
MTLYTTIKKYLQIEPKFRERSGKDNGIVNLLIERHPSLDKVDKRVLIEMVKDYNSMDRMWRKVLKDNEELRGSDYEDKAYLEQVTQIGLGYESAYYQNRKLL